MLSLGLHTIERWAPLGGFGAVEGDYAEGVCADGADFLCGPRDGLFSCRPCTADRLVEFRAFQTQLNRLVVARGLPKSLVLDVDGRVGVKTATTLGAVARSLGGSFPLQAQVAVGLAMNSPSTEQTAREIAKVVPTLRKYAEQTANDLNAPKSVPEPTKPVATGPGTTTLPPMTFPKKKVSSGVVVGVLAGITALGLVGAAAYAKRRR